MLATLAMKKRWQNKRKAAGKPFDNPNIVMNSAVQVCWEKAARYFDIEEKYVYCTPDRYVIDPKEAVDVSLSLFFSVSPRSFHCSWLTNTVLVV